MSAIGIWIWDLRSAYNRFRRRPFCEECGRHLPDVFLDRCRCGDTVARRFYSTGRVDEVLARRSLNEIAEAWTRLSFNWDTGELFPKDDPDAWAPALWLNEAFLADEERVRAGLLLLVEHAPDDDVLGHVGAGPLEDYVKAKGQEGDGRRWLEEQAEVSPRFKRALSNAYGWPPGSSSMPRYTISTQSHSNQDNHPAE